MLGKIHNNKDLQAEGKIQDRIHNNKVLQDEDKQTQPLNQPKTKITTQTNLN